MRTTAEIRKKLSELKPTLAKQFYVSAIGMFGSYVRNEQTDESDIDLIVDFSKPVGIEFVDLAEFLESNLQARVDLVSLNGIKPKYLAAIKPEIDYV